MKHVRSLSVAPLVLALAFGSLGALGCSGTVEQAPQTSASAMTKAPVGATTHGAVKMVGEALGEVPLRPEQRAELEKLAQEADARHASMLQARKQLVLAFADQVESGSLDKAALQPKIDAMKGEMAKVRPADSAALARVHAILDPEQRNAFVDALEAQMKAKRGEWKHGKGHHQGHGGKHGLAGMKQLADDLKLTEEQREQIKEQIKDAMRSAHAARAADDDEGGERGPRGWKAMRERAHEGKKALESFRGETFDADALSRAADLHGRAAEMEQRFFGVAEKIVPILTPEQRKLAADKLRAMATQAPGALPR